MIKQLFLNTALLFLFGASLARAQSKFQEIAIPAMKIAVLQSFILVPENKNCPLSAAAAYDTVAEARGGATSSAAIIISLVEKIEPNRQKLLTDSSQCGKCLQVNQVASFTTSEPEKTVKNVKCDVMPTVNIRKTLRNEEVQSYASTTVRGGNAEGKELHKGCPDPCSFYVASATTDIGNGQSLLNLTVHCGQPRAGSILLAKYKFTSGLVHKWSCQ